MDPASETAVVVQECETRDQGWTLGEAMKAVVSGGINGPREMI